ncbi:hypothetical protein G7047_30290 (plasmid) [Diaphorobacter sp. HDW4A]|jgi:hypothetical protein|uniref:hypothetical protein n=1 Tax=Diaphorobacter sp. HDW4A TaxID=2714924 RepID=UPI00140D39F6|nr:hypothetical protein [Diaphorobacter sp. HDW4A]QIL84310.1 hypothetical protein G7047_30290 [Diaphorobacter sp. HDW4A]
MDQSIQGVTQLPSGWTLGWPPVGEVVVMSCRIWRGIHEGIPVSCIAGNPIAYLKARNLSIYMEAGVTAIHGSIFMKEGIPFILDIHGAPSGAYPDAVIGWSCLPDGQQLLKEQALFDIQMRVVKAGRD